MTEVYEHNPNDHEDPIAGPTWLVGFIGAVFMLVIVFGLTALYYGAREQEVEAVVIEEDYVEFAELQAAQNSRLEVLQIEEREEGGERYEALVIPIEQAMELTAAEYGSNP
ncbi:MAG: hypothetical protein ACYTGG_14645 [Planctomycetota bacterium]|jgi:hypothetical protein